jgi:hypothetical protein
MATIGKNRNVRSRLRVVRAVIARRCWLPEISRNGFREKSVPPALIRATNFDRCRALRRIATMDRTTLDVCVGLNTWFVGEEHRQ